MIIVGLRGCNRLKRMLSFSTRFSYTTAVSLAVLSNRRKNSGRTDDSCGLRTNLLGKNTQRGAAKDDKA